MERDAKESFCMMLTTKLSSKKPVAVWPSWVGRDFGDGGLVLFLSSKDPDVTERLLCRQNKSIQIKSQVYWVSS